MKLGNRIDNHLGEFHVDIENLIDHFFGPNKEAETESNWRPRASLAESDKEYSLVLELAGVSAQDVTIEMQDGKLEVSGEKVVASDVEGERILKSERLTGKFHRAFDFATQIDPDGIVADFKNGLLTIKLPKSEKVLPRKIEIKTAN